VHKHGISGEAGPDCEKSQGTAGNPTRVRRASRNHRDADNDEGQLIRNFEPLPARGVSVERESRSRSDHSCRGHDAQRGCRSGDCRPSPKEQKHRDQQERHTSQKPWPPGRCVDAPELTFKPGRLAIDDKRNLPVGTIDPSGRARTRLSCQVTLLPDERRCQPTAWRGRRVVSPAPPAVGADAFTSTPPGVNRTNGSRRYPRMIVVWPGARLRRTARSLS